MTTTDTRRKRALQMTGLDAELAAHVPTDVLEAYERGGCEMTITAGDGCAVMSYDGEQVAVFRNTEEM